MRFTFYIVLFFFCISYSLQAQYYVHQINAINEQNIGALRFITKDKINRHIVATDKGIFVLEAGKFTLIQNKLQVNYNCTQLTVKDDFTLIYTDENNDCYSTLLNNLDNLNWKINSPNDKKFITEAKQKINSQELVFLKRKQKVIPYLQGFLEPPFEHQIIDKNIFVKADDKWFEIVNNNIVFNTHNEFPQNSPRLVLPINSNLILISFDLNNSLFLKDISTDSVINIGQKNKSLFKNESSTTFYHAIIINEQYIHLLGVNSKVYELDLKSLTLKLVNEINNYNLNLKNVSTQYNGIVYYGTYKGDIVKYNLSSKTIKVYSVNTYEGLSDTYRLYIDNEGLLWVGMQKGFAVLNISTDKMVITQNIKKLPLTNNTVTAFGRIDNHLWCGSYQTGLWHTILPYNFSKTLQINIDSFISLSNKKVIEDNNILFINTFENKAIVRTASKLYAIKKNFQIENVLQLKDNVGVSLSNQYNYIANKVYFTGIVKGFASITNLSCQNQLPSLNIEEIITQNKTIRLPYNWNSQKNFSINATEGYVSFTPILYNISSSVKIFEYTVNGKRFYSNANGSIIILLPAKGVLNISIKNIEASIYDDALKFSITILQPWYSTLWFKVLIGILITSLLLGIYYFKRKSNQYKTQAVINEITTLRSQLNPHFISNSLNSINAFVLQNKSEQASDYIVKFAKLMHLILQNSTQEFVTVDSELAMLKTYIEMEKLRFKEKFEYTINNMVNKPEQLIPAMIIQPYVENAIWHGLLQSKDKGRLDISLIQQGEDLEVTILDNGIGRKASEVLKSKQTIKRKSFGMKIVQKRLLLLQDVYKKKYTVTIIDLENPTGTKVKLRL